MEWVERTKLILRQPGFAGLLGSTFALGVGHSFVWPFLSLWGTQEIGMGSFAFSLYTTATSLSAIVVSTTLARWSDTHVPRKVMLMIGAAAGMLGYAGYAVFHDPRVLIVIGTTLLALSAVCFSQIFAHTREQFLSVEIPGVPPGFLLSVVRVCFSFAWTAGPTVSALLHVHYGFRGVFLGASALFLLFLLGVIQFVPFKRPSPEARAAIREPVWRVLTRGDLLALFVAFLLVFAAHTLNILNLPLALTQRLGGTGGDVGITFGVGPLAEIPLMLWFGLLAARGHQLTLLRVGAVSTVLYFLLLTQARTPWQVFPMQVLHGMSFAIFSNVGILFIQERLPKQPGLATTIYTNAGNAGNLIGFFSFQLVDSFGNQGLFLLSAAFTTVTLVIMMMYRPAERREAAAG